jgi:23S rRNA (guanosine2251-2'-O)-methyltransferase
MRFMYESYHFLRTGHVDIDLGTFRMKHGRRARFESRKAGEGGSAVGGDRVRIWGLHAVEAAVRNPARSLVRLRLTDNARHRLEPALVGRDIPIEGVNPRDFDRLLPADTVHQGALLEAQPLPVADVRDFAAEPAQAALVLVLDQVTDPHNVGAILRSAAAFGARGLVMTDRNSPPLEGALAKAASGGLELVPIALVPNLARALDQLAEVGYFRIGLAGEAAEALESQRLSGPTALVLGAEDTGLRRLTRETCDKLCRIAMAGGIASLNVSNAAAVAMHSVLQSATRGGAKARP